MPPDSRQVDVQQERGERKPAPTLPQEMATAAGTGDVKLTEPKLLPDEQELRRIIDLIPQTMVVLNPDGQAIYANRVALEYTGLSLDELRAEMHRRDALWQVEKAGRRVGPLLESIFEPDGPSPLSRMNSDERLVSDYHGTGLTTGPHPMAYRRNELRAMGIKSAAELKALRHGRRATVAGSVITRQRPGTAKGLIFMTLEDETGNANVIVTPAIYEKNRAAVLYERFVLVGFYSSI
jgi:PAS domain-containing protein